MTKNLEWIVFLFVYFTIPLSHDIMQTRLSFNALPCFAFEHGAKAEVESFASPKLFDWETLFPTLILALHLLSLPPAQCQHELYLVAPLSCSCYSFPNSKGTHDTMSSHLRNHINNKLHRLFRKWISYLEAHEKRWKAENLLLPPLRSWNWSHPDVKKKERWNFTIQKTFWRR